MKAPPPQDDVDDVTGCEPAVATPRRAKHHATAVVERLDHTARAHAVDGAVDVCAALRTHTTSGSNGTGTNNARPAVANEGRGESL